MNDFKLGAVESRFADLSLAKWAHRLHGAGQTGRAGTELEKVHNLYGFEATEPAGAFFQNQDGTVTSLLSREAFMPHRADGLWRKPSPAPSPRSSPFTTRKKLSKRMTWTSSRS